MTYDQLIERLITDGIAEVREAYADPKNHHKRDGAIEGFEACRGKTPAELIELLRSADKDAMAVAHGHRGASDEPLDYWRLRYKSLQIEFVLNVLSVGLTNSGHAPLLAHLPTYRGTMKYAEIVGVQSRGEAS